MTKQASALAVGEATGRCGWCRRPLPTPKATGRPRRYCSQPCRQWDWVARRGARDATITEEQLVLARHQVDELHDALYVLACAVEDTERDIAALTSKSSAADVRAILEWLMENARPVLRLQLRPT